MCGSKRLQSTFCEATSIRKFFQLDFLCSKDLLVFHYWLVQIDVLNNGRQFEWNCFQADSGFCAGRKKKHALTYWCQIWVGIELTISRLKSMCSFLFELTGPIVLFWGKNSVQQQNRGGQSPINLDGLHSSTEPACHSLEMEPACLVFEVRAWPPEFPYTVRDAAENLFAILLMRTLHLWCALKRVISSGGEIDPTETHILQLGKCLVSIKGSCCISFGGFKKQKIGENIHQRD